MLERVPSFDELGEREFLRLKRLGLSDADIAAACESSEDDVRARRRARGVRPAYRRVDSCAGEVEAGLELPLLDLGRGGRGAARARALASSSSARARTGSGRGSSSTTAACTPRRVPRARLRGGDGQLQPRDRLHRLRHLRPPLLRAAPRRGGARRPRARAAGGRRDPVRRPDAAQARPGDRARRLPDPRDAVRRGRPRGGPRALRRARRPARRAVPGVGDRRGARGGGRRRRRAIGYPVLVRPSYVLGGRAMRVCYDEAQVREALAAVDGAACSSTASSRTRSRSTSTRSATGRRRTSAQSCSTSRRPACTPATRRACCRRRR